MNLKTQKVSVTAFLDPITDEPLGFIYFNKNRDFVIFKSEKACEEDIEQFVKSDAPLGKMFSGAADGDKELLSVKFDRPAKITTDKKGKDLPA